MPSKKEKQQQALAAVKAQTTPLANSTNTTPTTNPETPLSNSYQTETNNHITKTTTTTTKKLQLINDSTASLDHLSLIRDQKSELDQLNNRFSLYVLALRKKTKENDDLQKSVDSEKQKQKNLTSRDNNGLETQMDEFRTEIDESAVITEHFIRKRNRALKDLALLKDKIRTEDDPTYANRRQVLENEYQQTIIHLKELTRRFEDLEKVSQTNRTELNQMNDLYKKLEDELHDLVLNNIRIECNLRTIEEKTLLIKAVYETEKVDLASEQIKQQLFYTNELEKAIEDIKLDFQTLLKTNKAVLETAYTERIEQVKTQISAYQATKQQETPTASRVSLGSLHEELKQSEKAREEIDNQYRSFLDLYMNKQKEKNQNDEERIRLDGEYSRLMTEINHLTEAIEAGKQYWFSVHFELETYRRLLDLETTKATIINNHVSTPNGKEENGPVEESRQIITVKKTDSQRAISKTGKFDIDQVTAGFISINNAATNCVDQPLKGWTLVRSVNDEQGNDYQFPDTLVLKAKTRVRVYSNKVENNGTTAGNSNRLVATAIPAWASTGQGDNVIIVLLDEKGINRAQYSERWQ